ncbi:DUF7927 domain-containing protein [Nakamurella leprariae]|uniref:DUF11 domain-containing protein n=1 Tax=Nakamurella leprariae TaxID=2803911 RepID=A0A938YDM7_9ACTN|nr:LPXTG cell wall anchor domain-containing protein [Nakamurella leprariae]MBM9467668.1 DUF11 domain-containing protein [Nakamurella leprariae]
MTAAALTATALITLAAAVPAGAVITPTRIGTGPAPAPRLVPAATATTAVVEVNTGGDRVGVSGVSPLAGVQLGLFAGEGDANPVNTSWALCTSDGDGDCSFQVPDTQSGGANRNARYWVKQVAAPAGWTVNATLRTGDADGSGSQATPYAFRTPSLRAGNTYTSGEDFMTGGSYDRTASGGVWQTSRSNPVAGDCGLDVALVLDVSGSVGSSMPALQAAGRTLVNSLIGTPSSVGLFTFASTAPANSSNNRNRPVVPVSTAAGAGMVNGWINGTSSGGGTNWDRGLAQVAASDSDFDVAIVITDGNPSFYGSPTKGPGDYTRFVEVENGIFSANAVKAEGTRVVAMGVGAGVSGFPQNLAAISGPVVNSDYYQTADYTVAGQALRALALENCAGSVSVVKEVIPPGGTLVDAQPAAGWTFDATAANATVTPGSAVTDATGGVSFDLAFADGTTSSPVTVTETQQAGYSLVSQGGANAVCTNLASGTPVPVTNAGPTGFTVAADTTAPISCVVVNQAPTPQAAVQVEKQWVVDGVAYSDGAQPAGLVASPTVNGAPATFGAPVSGFTAGDTVTIDEVATVLPGCTVISATVTAAGTSLPATITLPGGLTTVSLTNTVSCDSSLTLTKEVAIGDADPAGWVLTATGPDGSLTGPTGGTGVTAQVTAGEPYTLTETGGDPRYVQAVDDTGRAQWNCTATLAGGPFDSTEAASGTVVVGLGEQVTCTAVNVTAEVTLAKQVVNDAGGTAAPGDFQLTATPTGTVPPGLGPVTVPGSAAGAVALLRPGQPYALTEAGPAGYTGSVACSVDGGAPQPATSVTAQAGQSVVCQFTNDDIAPQLTLAKVVANGATGGTAVAADFTLTAVNGDATITGAAGSAAVTDQTASAGTWTLSEDGPDGYSGSVWTCATAAGVPVAGGDQVTLELGQDVTCIVTNTAVAPTLTLVKQVVNSSGGSAEPEDWTLTASGPVTVSGTTGSAEVTDAAVATGTYDLREAGPSGYSRSNWTCTGASASTADSVTVALGDEATCTLVNTDQPATLTLVKDVETGTTGSTAVPADWTLTATPDGIAGQPVVSGNGDPTSAGGVALVSVFAGEYVLTERGPDGFTELGWQCQGAVVAPSDLGIEVSVPSGGNVICTVTNTAVAPTLTLVKQVDNGSTGGTAEAGDWTLTADGPTPISGVTGAPAVTSAPVAVGSYTLTESGLPGYTAGQWECAIDGGGLVTGDTVTLAEGQDAVCSIVNTAVSPTLTLVKSVTNSHGGTAVPTDWTLAATGADAEFSGTTGSAAVTAVEVPVGEYDLAETGDVPGYVAGGWTCVGAGDLVAGPGSALGISTGTVTLGLGDEAVCAIVNADRPADLTLAKVVDAGQTGSPAVPAEWTLTATPVDLPGQPVVSGSGDPLQIGGVDEVPVFAGQYRLSESGPQGWTPGDWTCTGGQLDGDLVTVPTGGEVSCSITNTAQPATLTLVKQVVNGDTGGTAVPADWTLTATGPVTVSGTSGAAAITAAVVPVGNYTLSESGPDGYMAGSWVCDGVTIEAGRITVGVGIDLTCTVTNTAQAPTLTLVKQVDNGNTGTAEANDWTLQAAGPVTVSGVTASDGVTAVSVPAGEYTLSETGGPDGYVASGWICSDAPDTVVGTVTLILGADVTCTITNSVAPAPGWELVKTADPVTETQVVAGTPITYTLTATNTGNVAITGAQAVDDLSQVLDLADLQGPLPAGLTLDGAALNWALPELSFGGTVSVSYTVVVRAGLDTGTLINTAAPVGDTGGSCGECGTLHRIVSLTPIPTSSSTGPTTTTTVWTSPDHGGGNGGGGNGGGGNGGGGHHGGGNLPDTGVPASAYLLWGAALLAGGLALLWFSRRNRATGAHR